MREDLSCDGVVTGRVERELTVRIRSQGSNTIRNSKSSEVLFIFVIQFLETPDFRCFPF